MSFEFEVKHCRNLSPFNPLGDVHTLTATYSDVASLSHEFILTMIISKIADKFVEEHYAEIEKELDVKVIAAAASAQMGSVVEEKLRKEVERIQEVAEQALRRAKKR